MKTAGSTVTHYIHDRMGHLLAEANGATGATLKEYLWLDDLPLAVVDSSGGSPILYYIHTDALGSPQKLTDSSKAVVWDGAFDPFGNTASLTGSITSNLRFPGQYFDAETALHQNWNRDYDPSIGRYIQSDPIGLDGGINPYSYVLNNPPRYRDNDGTGVAGAIFGGVVGGLLGGATGPGDGAFIAEGAEIGSEIEDAINARQQSANNVQNAKAEANALGRCRAGMSPWQLRQRYNAWLQLAIARAKHDQKCWNGGDRGHQQAQADAWTNVGNCAKLM